MKSNLSNIPSRIFLPVLLLFIHLVSLSAQTVNCPADIVQNNDPGTCSSRVTFPNVANSDPNLTVVFSKPSGALFPVGTTTILLQLLDQNGSAVSSCSFNVTVVDKEAPVISNCPTNIVVNNTKDACGANVSFTPPTIFERCTSQQKTFNYTGAPITFVVPAGVTSINADVKGAAGGRTYYNSSVFSFPGLGGEVQGTIPVTPGQVLIINIGGAGMDGSAASAGSGGFNGGGNGTASVDQYNIIDFAGGGGGGASDIRIASGSLTDRIIVAGGGGAAGFTKAGGAGGDVTGANGEGGTSVATGGSQTAGGTGASYSNDFFAGNGLFGTGGNGADQTPAGGGGAGYYGGGGGSFGSGAGGSSYAITSATSLYHIQGAQEGNGSVTLKYDQPPTLAQTAGLPSGAFFPVGETTNTFTATDAAGNTSLCTFKVTVTDNQLPAIIVPASQTFNTIASTYSIPALVATDNCGIASVIYSITGATVRPGTGVDASGAFNAGTSIINFTVSDIHGNVQTGTTTITVTAPPSATVNIADVWAVAPWGNPNTIYLGFGPATLTLTATVSSGTAPLTYTWQKIGDGTVISTSLSLVVSSSGIYTLAVKDKNGAIVSVSKEIKMEDLRCGNNDDKVAVCHMPTDASDKVRTICVSKNMVNKFLGNGNYLGNCRVMETRTMGIETGVTATQAEVMLSQPEVLVSQRKKFGVYPNPVVSQLNIQLNNYKAGKAEVVLLSQNGMAVQRKTIELKQANQGITFNTSKLAAGIYLVKVVSEEGLQTTKVLVQH
jgi:hypothetical protein